MLVKVYVLSPRGASARVEAGSFSFGLVANRVHPQYCDRALCASLSAQELSLSHLSLHCESH